MSIFFNCSSTGLIIIIVEWTAAAEIAVKKEYLVYPNGLRPFIDGNFTVDNDLVASVMSYNSQGAVIEFLKAPNKLSVHIITCA